MKAWANVRRWPHRVTHPGYGDGLGTACKEVSRPRAGLSRCLPADRKPPPCSRLALLILTDQGWRLPRPPAGLPAGLREPAAGLLAGLLRGFCTLDRLPLDKLVPLPVAIARCAAGLRLFSPICG